MRDHPNVTGEHDRFGRNWWDVHRDLSSMMEVESFSDKFAGDRLGLGRFRPCLGEIVHALILTASRARLFNETLLHGCTTLLRSASNLRRNGLSLDNPAAEVFRASIRGWRSLWHSAF